MSRLAAFQNAFVRRLNTAAEADHPTGLHPLISQPGFSVHRNTIVNGLVDALEANFAAVVRLVGVEWFRAAATIFCRSHPPASPVLFEYGSEFPDFLSRFEPAAELPYLAAVASLDRLWSEAHGAPDAEPLDLRGFLAWSAEPHRLRLHPSARIGRFRHTAPTLWLDARGLSAEVEELRFEAIEEGALIVRPQGQVLARKIVGAELELLDLLRQGKGLEAACDAAQAAEPAADLAAILAGLIDLGALIVAQDHQSPHEGTPR